MARLSWISSAALGVSLAVANPWGSERSREFARKAFEARSRGDLTLALSTYEAGYRDAVTAANSRAQIRFLNSLGAAHQALFQFQPALQHLLEARSLAEKHPYEFEEHGAILFNLASLYLATSNIEAADEAAREGSRILNGRKATYYQPRLHLIRAVIAANQQRAAEAEAQYAWAIEASDRAGDDAALALIFNRAGLSNLASGDLDSAERRLLEAFRLRALRRDGDLVYTLVGLGELDLARGRLDGAWRLAQRAYEIVSRSHHPMHRHIIEGLRARILHGQRRFAEAHQEYLRAFTSIRRSRADVLPSDLFRISTEASFERLYDNAIRNALDWEASGLPTPGALAAEIWLATEEWKASVAGRPSQTRNWTDSRLSPEYWRTLNELRDLERSSFTAPVAAKSPDHRISTLRVRLAEIESFSGVRPLSTIFSENFSTQKALVFFRDSLPAGSSLIRFHVGKRSVVRWVFSGGRLVWKELQVTEVELDRLVAGFNEMIREGGQPEQIRLAGRQLYEKLFGGISPEALRARYWLLALDGALLQLPVAALSVSDSESGRLQYLVEAHALQVVTGVQALLAGPAGDRNGEFVGVGDAVYNTADPRWGKKTGGNSPRAWPWGSLIAQNRPPAEAAELNLPRLASSSLELRKSADAWRGPSRLLLGPNANRQAAIRSIESGAAVVHFATHFLQHQQSPDRALLVLSLDAQGRPDFFSPSDAAHIRVPDSLVVLSGCHSAAGKLVPAAGLIGMTRAWLLAGASGVIASLWPTPDDSGAIFQAFYSELRRHRGPSSSNGDGDFQSSAAVRPRGGIVREAADALRYAQLEMLRTNSWRALPRYWGTYQLVGRTM